MNMKNEQDAQELGEQELEQASGAGANNSVQCACGSTEYEIKIERHPFPMASLRYKECKSCHKKYYDFFS